MQQEFKFGYFTTNLESSITTVKYITSLSAHKKKTSNTNNNDDDNDGDESINIKQISKDEYEKRT